MLGVGERRGVHCSLLYPVPELPTEVTDDIILSTDLVRQWRHSSFPSIDLVQVGAPRQHSTSRIFALPLGLKRAEADWSEILPERALLRVKLMVEERYEAKGGLRFA